MGFEIPDVMLDLLARKFSLLSDRSRLSILRVLIAGEFTVGEICERTQAGQANVSKHLKLLHEGGLLGRRKEGLAVYYSVTDPFVAELCKIACASVARDAEVELQKQSHIRSLWQGDKR